MTFEPGQVIERREVLHGELWLTHPVTVIKDDGEMLAVRLDPGSPFTFPPHPFGVHPWAHQQVWGGMIALQLYRTGDLYSVWRFFEPDGTALHWYINFESVLVRGPAHIDTEDFGFGQIYNALASFEKRGFAEVESVEVEAGPERKRYRITPEGVEVVEDWLRTPEPPEAYASAALLTKLSVALLSGRDPQFVLAAQREAHMGRMRELTKQRRDASGAHLLAITYELAHLDADLRWIVEAGPRLQPGGEV